MPPFTLSWTAIKLPGWLSTRSPALASIDKVLYLAWVDSNNCINLSRRDTAATTPTWEDRLILDKTSREGPALVVVDRGAGKGLLMVWRANDLSESIYTATSDDGLMWSPSLRLDWTTPKGPTVVGHGQEIFLAWTSSDSTHQIFHARAKAGLWTEARPIKPISPIAPALIEHKGDVWLAGSSDKATPNAVFISKPKGTPAAKDYWDSPSTLPPGATAPQESEHRPALASHASGLLAAWPDRTMKSISIGRYDATGKWEYLSYGSTHVAPALTIHDGNLHMAWIVPGTNEINLASSPV
jgi:hypothetical protein